MSSWITPLLQSVSERAAAEEAAGPGLGAACHGAEGRRDDEDDEPVMPAPLPKSRASDQSGAAAQEGAAATPGTAASARGRLEFSLARSAARRRRRATATGPSPESLENNARLLENVLQDYGVQGKIVEIRPGPVVTLYELEPAPGIRSARVVGLADDIARSLSVVAVRIATVSGRNVIGIEVPNAKRETVFFSELLGAEIWESRARNSPSHWARIFPARRSWPISRACRIC